MKKLAGGIADGGDATEGAVAHRRISHFPLLGLRLVSHKFQNLIWFELKLLVKL